MTRPRGRQPVGIPTLFLFLSLLVSADAGLAGDRLFRLKRPGTAATRSDLTRAGTSSSTPMAAPGTSVAPAVGRRFYPCFFGPEGPAVPRGTLQPLAALRARRGGTGILDGREAASGGAAKPGTVAAAATDGIDTLRVAFIRCDFLTDRGGDTTTTPDGKFDLRTGIKSVVDPPPHNRAYFEAHGEALRRYYRAQSLDRLEILPSVFPADSNAAYHLGDTMDYGPWALVVDSEAIAAQADRLCRDALEAARLSGEIDFQAFDAFIVVHAGADFQGDINGDSPRDIPSFTLEFAEPAVVDGKSIARILVLPEATSQDDLLSALNGVLAHEFGHILGLPDLYSTRTGTSMVGYWSLMDSGHNIAGILVDSADDTEVEVLGALPASLDPWCRLQLFGGGYLGDNLLVASGTLRTVLGASLLGPNLVYVGIADRRDPEDASRFLAEYYLVENRAVDLDGNGYPILKQDRQTGVFLGPVRDDDLAGDAGRLEYDALLPGGGLLVWQIDERVIFGDLADPLGVNTIVGRRGIRPIEADAIEDLGRRNYGTLWDPFFVGNNTTFGPFTVPRTHSNDGQFSRITLETNSPPGPEMGLSVDQPTDMRGWPLRLRPDIKVEHVAPLDVTGDGSPEILFAVGGNVVAVQGRGGSPYPHSSDPNLAVPFIPGLLTLDPRLAARTTSAGADPGPALAARAGNRILAWDAAGRPWPESVAYPPVGASTPPAFGGRGWYAYGTFEGRGVLAGPTPDPGNPIAKLRESPPALRRDETADPVAGNVVWGALSGNDGETEIAFSTEGGRVHLATTAGGAPAEGGAPGTLVELGATADSIGTQPISLVAADFRASSGNACDVAAVDRNGLATLIDLAGSVLPGWPVRISSGIVGAPAAGDMDGDGCAELVVAGADGKLNVLNGDGSAAISFPKDLGAVPTSGPVLADLDDEPGAEALIMTRDGSLHAIGREGREVVGFPLAMGGRTVAGPMLLDLDGDGRLDLAAGSKDHYLIGTSLDLAIPDTMIVWGGEDGGAGRNAVLDSRFRRDAGQGSTASRGGDLICYPNPVRGDRLHVRFFLQAGQAGRVDVFDLLGRPVAEGLAPAGGAGGGEADVVWNVTGAAPGVYLVRIGVEGPGSPGVRWRTVSVIH